MTSADIISDYLSGFGVEQDVCVRLGSYGELVLVANKRMNLTAAREPLRLAEHILDSLTLAADIDGALIDLGSGAGLPGIPLAIATGHRVALVDAVKKKAQFLKFALDELGLLGEVLDRRAEALAFDPAYRERFRCATARGVSSAPTVAELAVPFLEIGGKALLQRGAMEQREREALADAAPMLGAMMSEERLLGGDRRVVLLVKGAHTSMRFPRRNGIPAKRPLCFT